MEWEALRAAARLFVNEGEFGNFKLARTAKLYDQLAEHSALARTLPFEI